MVEVVPICSTWALKNIRIGLPIKPPARETIPAADLARAAGAGVPE
jgi:hypothetical protein